MSKNKQDLLALIACASAIANNPLLRVEQRKKHLEEYRNLWLDTTQKVRDQFVQKHHDLFKAVDDFRFETQHPSYAAALKANEGEK